MAGTMKVVEPRAGGAAVARVTGWFDFAAVQEARGHFRNAIAGGSPRPIVALSKVDFVDSAGLGSLIGGMRAAR